MAVPVEQFVKQLEDSGILAGDTLKDFLPPKGTPKDAEELARELVKQKKLTKFQAEEIYKGKGKSLTLGNYVLMEKIGAGGMGQVFKARHRRMDRLVAVKLLPPAMTKDKAAIARFEREVKAAAKLRHPNIVAADDADQANGVHFLVMELVEGSDLSALVKKNGPFGIDQAVNYITQAARGLEAAHAEGIVHRDIKPANLLLDKRETVKVLDMGLARIEGSVDAPTQAELTSTGTVMGTVDYMAPEQALNTKTADARADIYSLGCSLFYLLCGKATYDGDTLMAKLLNHREQPIPSLRATRPEVSERLDSIFAKMVAKKVEDRYQTMTEVIAELERCRNFNEQTITNQQPLSRGASSGSTTNPSLSNFLTELSQPAAEAMVMKPALQPKAGQSNSRLKLIAAGVLGGLILLFGIIVKLKTKEGKLIVEVNEPGAVVQVLDEVGKVQITRKNEQGTITISVVPGKHQLKVEKDGFKVITKDFEIETNGTKTITAKLIPLKKTTGIVGKTPPENPPVVTSPPVNQPTGPTPPPAIAPFDAAQAKAHQEAWAKYLGVPVEYTNSIGMKFVLIPPGEFLMGSDEQETKASLDSIQLPPEGANEFYRDVRKWRESQTPQRRVRLTQPRYLGQHEVTQRQYEKVTGANPFVYAKTGPSKEHADFVAGLDTADFPVDNVSWQEAIDFCGQLSQLERLSPCFAGDGDGRTWVDGIGYRLPSEAEWEFACRAGTITLFWSGQMRSDLDRAGWIGFPCPKKVGTLAANPFGMYDVHGNVLEWVYDAWDEKRHDRIVEGAVIDPLVHQGIGRILRGGHLGSDPYSVTSAVRYQSWFLYRDSNFGFRASLSVDAVRQGLAAKSAQWPADAPKPAVAPFDAEQARKYQQEWADYLKVPVEYTNAIGMKFRLIPPGEFMMGSSDADITLALKIAEENKLDPAGLQRIQDERPQHLDRITKPFRLGIHEVTIGQFGKFIEQSGYKTQAEEFGGNSDAIKADDRRVTLESKKLNWRTPGPEVGENSAVTQVSWNDAVAFCNWLSAQDKLEPSYVRDGASWELVAQPQGYRLPTEAEWEYACRAGTTTQYSFGDDWKEHDKFGWSNTNAGGRPRGVGLLPANPFGLHDMHGNVWEWCHDWYDGQWYARSPSDDPKGPNGALSRVNRGGSWGGGWSGTAATSRSSCRNFLDTPAARHVDRGFRVGLGSVGARPGTASVTPQPAVPAASSGKLFMHDPAFPQWMKDVQAMPAEKQIEAVSKKLMELNPGFDGKVMDGGGRGAPKVENGVVTEFGFYSAKVTDISPVRALSGLMTLKCSGESQGGPGDRKLTDLSPLSGMQLAILDCSYNYQLSDLSSLKEIPLVKLFCYESQVADLTPLQSCKKLETLRATKTKITSETVAALKKALPGCDIRWDDPAKAPPAAPTKLFMHNPAFPQWVKDVQALPAEKQIEAVSKKMVELNPGFDGTLVRDRSDEPPKIENGIVIKLGFVTDKVTDISPVRALTGLFGLDCYGSSTGKGALKDLSPLKGMKFTYFVCFDNPGLFDLSPLKEIPLELLWFSNTNVSDLSPLQGMPLFSLVCNGTQIFDYSPLKDMSLTELDLDFKPERDTELLRSIKTLEQVNDKPLAEFWKEVEQQKKGKKKEKK